jgi:hypothetical protein
MDFSISNNNLLDNDQPFVDVYQNYDIFLNRLRRVKFSSTKIRFIANWKKEFSIEKGPHVHTVFYFDYTQVKKFSPKTKLFQQIEGLWASHTKEACFPAKANIHIVPSYLCESTSVFRAQPYQGTDDPKYREKHFYTILTKNYDLFEELDEYHQQKHFFDKPCGFVYWLSYMAKTEQQAPLKTSFGVVRNM